MCVHICTYIVHTNVATCMFVYLCTYIVHIRGGGRQSIQEGLIGQQEKFSMVKIKSYEGHLK